jgi:hypothetical protein
MIIFQKYIHVQFIMGLRNNGFNVEFFYFSSSCDLLNNFFLVDFISKWCNLKINKWHISLHENEKQPNMTMIIS